MKAALIPPIPELQRFGRGNFHLLLSHLLSDHLYFDHYLWQRNNGAYIVLDNSAHEAGEGDDPEALLYHAAALRAQEVVVPDVLDDFPATIERAIEALETWFEEKQLKNIMAEHAPALMYVPQGKDWDDYVQCLKELTRLHMFTAKRRDYRSDYVLGVSKDYEKWDGGLMALINEVIKPHVDFMLKQHRTQVHVHLLGWGRNLWDLEIIAKKHPWIRSTDSAKPFVYALKGVRVRDRYDTTGRVPKYPTRPEDYFHKALNLQQQAVALDNARFFTGMAMGDPDRSVTF